MRPSSRDVVLLTLVVLALRLPFIGQAVQGDDVYYLLLAENAQVDPWHPMQTAFRLQGETVWAAGHTRPPGAAYILGALIALLGPPGEVSFHLAYILFSLIAVLAMYALARRFTDRPLLATLLFAAFPAFIVNGNKLEADLPLAAFWTLGLALVAWGRYRAAIPALGAAGMLAYQAVFATPLVALWAWREARGRKAAWAAALAAPATLAAWQLFERATSGAAPAAVLAGYFAEYDLYALQTKIFSTLALLGHLGWMAAPVWVLIAWKRRRVAIAGLVVGVGIAVTLPNEYLFIELFIYSLCAACGAGVLLAAAVDARRGDWLAFWVVAFFAAAVVVFYAGSARYLLPLAPALAIWLVRQKPLWAAVGVHAAVSLLLAVSEYGYVNQYRDFARELAETQPGRVWSNAEWGLRYYLSELGGEPLLRDQSVPAGATVVESDLAAAIPYGVAGGKQELLRAEIATGPVRLIGKGSRSGYSSSQFGVLPFGLGGGVIDTVTAYKVGAADPTVSGFRMVDAEADAHLLSGFYPSDGADWRWMGPRGTALLRVPDTGARELVFEFHIPEDAPARRVRVAVDGVTVADETYAETGGNVLRAPVSVTPGVAVRVVITAEPSYSPPGDGRELAVVAMRLALE